MTATGHTSKVSSFGRAGCNVCIDDGSPPNKGPAKMAYLFGNLNFNRGVSACVASILRRSVVFSPCPGRTD
jgi:hypothetical protein